MRYDGLKKQQGQGELQYLNTVIQLLDCAVHARMTRDEMQLSANLSYFNIIILYTSTPLHFGGEYCAFYFGAFIRKLYWTEVAVAQ